MWSLATSAARAHRGAFAGTAIVLALAAALVAVTGVMFESGLRAPATSPRDALGGDMLVAVASSFSGFALVVVMIVVAATVSLALRGRRRELALLRAVGATPHQVRLLVTLELVVVTLVAAPVGAVLGLLGARLLDPLLIDSGVVAPDFVSTLSPWPVLGALLLVLLTAVPTGLIAAREAARTEPTSALRESAVEQSEVGPARRWGALAMAAAGLATAFSPMVVPGTVGSAVAAVSAFLLVGAAAMAGPVLVGWIFDRLAHLGGPLGRPAPMLAVRNVRGFSRRLTTVVVPLALIVTVATVQTSVDRAVTTAAGEQLEAALAVDLVGTADHPLDADDLDRLAAVPGIATVEPLTDVPAQVMIDTDEDLAWAEGLIWESTMLRLVPAVGATGQDAGTRSAPFDPGVVEGTLADLAAPGTVAISTDAAFEVGARLGGSLALRFGEEVVEARVVALYSRGLGVGDYLIGTGTAAAQGLDGRPGTVLVGIEPGADPHEVSAALEGMGVTSTDVPGYVDEAIGAGAADRRLSAALLLVLMVVVALGAATTLALTTASRREELGLLHRTGTTRRQLMAMTTIEALVTGLTAWGLGTLAVIPAVVGVSAGLLGARVPVVDVPIYAMASAGVVVLAVLAVGLASRQATRFTPAAV
ncbi:ABC transporter permease [Actinotalea sp. BY-33]|uniref:ABC transporter permease n=1 Tax=Actinotalea soli TaxID=2819234 RepID=A0A939LP11_9CELL|nr:ABC transporter permease [Actinotalea soli]MBO1752052.1 ABC transporter permease [Actinotalea soli]